MHPTTKDTETVNEATLTISNSLNDEKGVPSGHENYRGIDTRALHLGADEVYEKKVALLNEALIDIGMNSFQWKVAAMTGFGWFVDNVSYFLKPYCYGADPAPSSGCKPSPSSVHRSGTSSKFNVSLF
jgi:hypothetical protein